MERKFLHTNKLLFDRRKLLRNNYTPQEYKLWFYLRKNGLGYKFQRQHSIGPYIADFYCAPKRLIIEIDGRQHLDTREHDKDRTDYLISLDYKVLRFWNGEIDKDMKKVLELFERV